MGRPRSLIKTAVAVVAWVLAIGCQESRESSEAPQGPSPPDLILVTWDTVRWDHVGPASPEAESHTPAWDRYAREGVTFSGARTPVPITLPAHASILTGLSPAEHGARHNTFFSVDPAAPLLAQELRDAGYHTGAFVSSAVLDGENGLARGFEHYDDSLDPSASPDALPMRRGDRTVRAALDWAAEQPVEEPLFVWVHLYDPHRTWDAPALFAESFDPYRAEIAFADAQTGLFLEVLGVRRGPSRAVVVLTSDHGEGLGEHGEITHSFFAYDSTVRVPLLIWAGAESGVSLLAGSAIDGPASLLDIAPTLREVAGLSARPSGGRSLLASLRGEAVPPRRLTVETVAPVFSHGAAPIFGVLTGDDEFWYDVPRRERYDLTTDTQQVTNLYAAEDRATADALFAQFDFRWPPDAVRQPRDAELDQLAALGYVFDAAPAVEAEKTLPDAKDRLAFHRFLAEDPQLRNPRQVVAELASMRAELGMSQTLVRLELAVLQQLGRSADALELAEEAAAAFPDHLQIVEVLGALAAAVSKSREDSLWLRARIAKNPDDPDAIHTMASHHQLLQEFDDAIRLYRRLKQVQPARVDSALNYALVLTSAQRDGEALRQFDYLRALDGRSPDVDCIAGRALGWVLEAAERAHAAVDDCKRGGGTLSRVDRLILEGKRPQRRLGDA
jgi:arylsulfatase A-like enzyme